MSAEGFVSIKSRRQAIVASHRNSRSDQRADEDYDLLDAHDNLVAEIHSAIDRAIDLALKGNVAAKSAKVMIHPTDVDLRGSSIFYIARDDGDLTKPRTKHMLAGIKKDPLTIVREKWGLLGVKEVKNITESGKSKNLVLEIKW